MIFHPSQVLRNQSRRSKVLAESAEISMDFEPKLNYIYFLFLGARGNLPSAMASRRGPRRTGRTALRRRARLRERRGWKSRLGGPARQPRGDGSGGWKRRTGRGPSPGARARGEPPLIPRERGRAPRWRTDDPGRWSEYGGLLALLCTLDLLLVHLAGGEGGGASPSSADEGISSTSSSTSASRRPLGFCARKEDPVIRFSHLR